MIDNPIIYEYILPHLPVPRFPSLELVFDVCQVIVPKRAEMTIDCAEVVVFDDVGFKE